jgi:hypothetical protein
MDEEQIFTDWSDDQEEFYLDWTDDESIFMPNIGDK